MNTEELPEGTCTHTRYVQCTDCDCLCRRCVLSREIQNDFDYMFDRD